MLDQVKHDRYSLLVANILSTAKRVQIISALIEGNRLRTTALMVGCSKNSVTKLLFDLGKACSEYQDEALRDLPCKRLQVDEIWSFCQMKAKTARQQGRSHEYGVGDVWTFTAIDADTKLVPSWLVGSRDSGCAAEFCQDLASRLGQRVQLTSDGHRMYIEAVEDAFGADIDFAQIQKIYGEDPQSQKRYSLAKIEGCTVEVKQGCPDPMHASTSCAERKDLTMRRFTQLTNAFSKKVENHGHAIALHFMDYNFVKPHSTLTKQAKGIKTSPAMAAGASDRLWTLEQVVGLLNSN